MSAGTLCAPRLLTPVRFWAPQASFRKTRCHHGDGFRLHIAMHGVSAPELCTGGGDDTELLSGGCVAAHHAAGLRAVSISSSAFLSIFAGLLNESLVIKIQEKKGVPIPSLFPGGTVQFREGASRASLEGCAWHGSELHSVKLQFSRREKAAGCGRWLSATQPQTTLHIARMAAAFKGDEVLTDGLGDWEPAGDF